VVQSRLTNRITNAPLSSTFLIYAKTDTKGQPSKGITAFLVERGWKGFEVGEHLDKFGVSDMPPLFDGWPGKSSWQMRGSPTAELFFDNVEIPEGASIFGSGRHTG
jgi:isovaleryl-CoA dehydrogenase